MKKARFYVHKLKSQKSYVVYYVNPDTNKWEGCKSIRKLYNTLYNEDKEKFSKFEASQIASEALAKGLVKFKTVVTREEDKEEKTFFNAYCLNFWDYEKSDYFRRKNKEKPNSINIMHCKQSLLEENEKLKYPSQCALMSNELVDLVNNRIEETGERCYMQSWIFYLLTLGL